MERLPHSDRYCPPLHAPELRPYMEAMGLPAQLWKEVLHHYLEPHRLYHDWLHINQLAVHSLEARHTLQMQDQAIEPDQFQGIQLAVVFHDVIYDPRSKTNEADSEQFLLDSLERHGLTFPPVAVDLACECIRRTADHFAPSDSGSIHAPLVELFRDMDLGSLAAPWEEFLDANNRICGEYAQFYSPEEVRVGRIAFLKKVLAGPPIFSTAVFAAGESQARRNLERCVALMEAGGGLG